MPFKRLFVTVALLVGFMLPVQAQDTTPPNTDTIIIPLDEPETELPVEPAPPDQGILEAALALLIKAVTDITFLPVAAAFVVAMTALTKKLVPATISAAIIALAWQVVAWIAWVLALHLGYAAQFATWIDSLTTILTAVAGLLGSTFVATRFYNASVARNVPLFGTQRTSAAG